MQIYFLALIKLSKTSWKVKNKQTNIVVKLKWSYNIQVVSFRDALLSEFPPVEAQLNLDDPKFHVNNKFGTRNGF